MTVGALTAWWREAVIYENHLPSLRDGNGDGIGDLEGLIESLDYLADELGVDAIWVGPFFASPLLDQGFDVTDHTAVEPVFGDLQTFDRLIEEAHARGLKIIVDYIPNHTSDQHPWFAESRSSRESPKRDWYIWADPAPGGGPPNNWTAEIGGSTWECDEATGQYYLHSHLREQPDLNWRNPDVRAAMLDVLRFWIDRGVDGFRVDAMRQLLKDPQWRDNPPNPDWDGVKEYDSLLPVHSADLDEVQDVVAEIRRVIGDRLMVAEVYAPIERLVRYYGEDGRGAQLPFNFHPITTPWEPEAIAELVERYEAALPPSAWPNWVLGNHDRGRIASRVGSAQARVAAMLLLTLRGTPTLYYGDEIGMTDVPVHRYDPDGRDSQRTPFQWDSRGGFTTGEPWLPYGDLSVNVADNPPILRLHRALLALRREIDGAYRTLHAGDGVLAYARGDRHAVALNLTGEPRPLPVRGEVVLSTHLDGGGDRLRADEGVVLRI